MTTLFPYDREFLRDYAHIKIDEQEPEWIADPEPGSPVLEGVKNALIAQAIILALALGAYGIWHLIWRLL